MNDMPVASSRVLSDAGIGEAILTIATDQAVRAFGPRLVAVYALGSLAHGGFRPAVSDVDVGVVLDDPAVPGDPAAIDALTRMVRARQEPLADRLSVFWATPRMLSGDAAGGRFPPVDRADLREHGRLLWGRDIRAKGRAPTAESLVIAAAALARAGRWEASGRGLHGVAAAPGRDLGVGAPLPDQARASSPSTVARAP